MLRATGHALFSMAAWLLFLPLSTARANDSLGLSTPQGPAQLITRDPDSGDHIRLEIARLHIHVELMPTMALVQIEQSFYNPDAEPEMGTVVLNLPAEASVSRFATFTGDGGLMEAELIDSRYDGGFRSTIALEQSDPQMLTHIGENLFRIPVPEGRAHDIQRFLLDYTVPLVSEQGQYRFELPLASDLEPIWDFHLTGTLHPPVDVTSITSPSPSRQSSMPRKNRRRQTCSSWPTLPAACAAQTCFGQQSAPSSTTFGKATGSSLVAWIHRFDR